MKFTVSSSQLLSRLQTVGRVIPSKSTMSILENFLLQVSGNILTITGSDLDTTVCSTLEISDVDGEITIALPGKLLMETLKEFSDQPLCFDINTENYSVEFRTENGNYKFVGKFGGDYPQTKQLSSESETHTVSSSVLLTGISKTAYAAATEDLRPTMTGIFHRFTPEGITFVATDAHKLVRLTNTSVTSDGDSSFILPRKAANLLRTILGSEQGDVEVSFDSQNIVYRMPNYMLICRQIEGKFPNYQGVIPQNNPIEVIVDRQAFTNAIKRIAVFTNQGTNLIKIGISQGTINLSAQDIDFSTSANENISCQYEGDPISIGFKAPLLIDNLSGISSQDVRILLSDPTRAGLILPFENEENEDMLTLLMPMLIND
ncbi:MAG: DNA polymerase III subunit beta [Candidatus Aphodosoma sp.]